MRTTRILIALLLSFSLTLSGQTKLIGKAGLKGTTGAGKAAGGGGGSIAFVSSVAGPVTVVPGGGVSAAIDTSGANFLVLWSTDFDGTTTPSDSKSNTWHPLTSYATGSGYGRFWYAYNATTGTGHTFTVNGTVYYGTFEVRAYSGMPATDPFVSECGLVVDPMHPCTNGAGFTLPTGNYLVVTGTARADSDTATSWTLDSGFTSPAPDVYPSASGTTFGSALSDRIVTTGVSNLNPIWTPNTGATGGFSAAAVFQGN